MSEITHALITYSGIHYLITQDQYNKFLKKGREDEIIIDGCVVKVKNVGDPITIEKYYETYPNKRPSQTSMFDPKRLEEKPMGINGIIRETNNVFGLEQIAKGIRKYMASTEQKPIMPNSKDPRWFRGTDEPQNILDKIEKKIKLIQAN